METSRIDGGPARRSATGPTLHPAQLQKDIGRGLNLSLVDQLLSEIAIKTNFPF